MLPSVPTKKWQEARSPVPERRENHMRRMTQVFPATKNLYHDGVESRDCVSMKPESDKSSNNCLTSRGKKQTEIEPGPPDIVEDDSGERAPLLSSTDSRCRDTA